MIFDVETFAIVQGREADLIKSTGMAFGAPRCLINMTKDVLQLLPSAVLRPMSQASRNAKKAADDAIKEITHAIFLDSGIIRYDTETGQFILITDVANTEREYESGGVLQGIDSFLGTINGVLAAGGNLYNNYLSRKRDLEDIKNCIGKFKETLAFNAANSSIEKNNLTAEERRALVESKYAAEIARVSELQAFSKEVAEVLSVIQGLLAERSVNPDLEPEFNSKFASNLPDKFRIEKSEDEESKEEIFRLVFGPPESSKGKFLLSVDGLYYDSQTSGTTFVLEHLKKQKEKIGQSKRWRFDYDPNIGGKGVQISDEELRKYVGTIFDPNIIDESDFLKTFYNADNFLSVLIEQRDKRISDLKNKIIEYSDTGAGVAIIDNTRQELLSESQLHQDKINRRKKQIEIAVKAPSLYGTGPKFSPGGIPINDFSYLQDLNIAASLEQQKRLVLSQEDVSGVVLPIQTKYVGTKQNKEFSAFDNLLVAEVGVGEMPYETSAVSAQGQVHKSVTDTVITDGLIGIYNFLDSRTVQASSTEFLINNSFSENRYNNLQLVGKPDILYQKGLGVPFFEGVTKHQASSLDSTQPSSHGTFGRLPDTPEFRDLMYNKEGCTIDFWLYVPTLLDAEKGWMEDYTFVSSNHRLVLACENVGTAAGVSSQGDISAMQPDYGDGFVRGFVMGFTRDSRIVSGGPPNDDFSPSTLSGVHFFLAPTQSFDQSSAGYIRLSNSGCELSSAYASWSMNVSSVVNGKRFRDVNQDYMHVAVTIDPPKDQVKVYLDSVLMGTSSLQTVFSIPKGEPPRLPSMVKANSFNYASGAAVGPSATNALSGGPKLNSYFTPWIVGGGYTDGMQASGNFMGGQWGGKISGLRGHIGSMKFYNKPLTQIQITKNYTVQCPFFKNIRTHNVNKGKVFFLLGQSNANGLCRTANGVDYGSFLSAIPDSSAGYRDVKFERVYTWNLLNPTSTPEKRWDNLRAGYNNKSYNVPWAHVGQVCLGPECSLASGLTQKYPDENIYLVKMAWDGSKLAESTNVSDAAQLYATWSNPPIGAFQESHLFNHFLSATPLGVGFDASDTAVPRLLGQGNEELEVCGIFWVQGEADSVKKDASLVYETNFDHFVSSVRALIGNQDWNGGTSAIPFVAAGPHSSIFFAGFVEVFSVITAQHAVAERAINPHGLISALDLSAYNLSPDGLHLDSSSQLFLGNHLFHTYLNIIGEE